MTSKEQLIFNVQRILLSVLAALFGFAIFAGQKWVSGVENQISKVAERTQAVPVLSTQVYELDRRLSTFERRLEKFSFKYER